MLIVPVPGSGVRNGTTFGYRGAAIRLVVESDSTEADLADDWKAVHEMTHLALPDVEDPHLWLAEGIAVYVEPIARVQARDLTAQKIWGDMVRDMPQGLPKKGDRGLDRTPTWGRTYWGGAIFCLLADVEMRKQTGNRLGLQQALRGILAAGGNHEKDWRGRSSASSALPTRPPASPCFPISTPRCATNLMRQTSTRCGAISESRFATAK